MSNRKFFVPKTRLKKALRKLSKSCSDAGHILIETHGSDLVLTGERRSLVASIAVPIDLDDDESPPARASIAVSCEDAAWVASRLDIKRLGRVRLSSREAAFEALSGELVVHPRRPDQILSGYLGAEATMIPAAVPDDDAEALSFIGSMRPLSAADELLYFSDATDPDRDEREAHLAGVYVSGALRVARREA